MKNVNFPQTIPVQSQSLNRIQQPDVRPTVIKYNYMEFYDASNNTYTFRNNENVPLFIINPNDNTITFVSGITVDGTVMFADTVTMQSGLILDSTLTLGGLTVGAPVKELQLALLSGGATGGTVDSYFTSSATYQNLNASQFTINPANYPTTSFLLEAVYRAGASGDPARTFYMDLYDVVAAATVPNSEITGAVQSTVTAGGLPIVRGTINFRSNLLSGDRQYILRYRSNTAGRFVDLYYARLIVAY